MPKDWNRVKLYASWMRQVEVDEWFLGEKISNKLRSNSPPGGWFPALQDLSWCMSELSVLYIDLFLSPHLQRIDICASWSWDNSSVPPAILPTLVSIISALPTSSLKQISVDTSHLTMPCTSKPHSLPSFCVADHLLRNTTPRFHCRTTHWTI